MPNARLRHDGVVPIGHAVLTLLSSEHDPRDPYPASRFGHLALDLDGVSPHDQLKLQVRLVGSRVKTDVVMTHGSAAVVVPTNTSGLKAKVYGRRGRALWVVPVIFSDASRAA